MTINRFLIRAAVPTLTAGLVLITGAATTGVRAVVKSTQVLDYSALPHGVEGRHLTKWSGNVFLFMDKDYVAPAALVFGRSGQLKSSTTLMPPGTTALYLYDFAAAPDDSVWASGFAISTTGQESHFLEHLTGGTAQVVVLNSYDAFHLAVAPDGSVWTMGMGFDRDTTGKEHTNFGADVLRHFDQSGKLIASAMPLNTIQDHNRAMQGFLVCNRDRLGWYSPMRNSEYVELSLDGEVLHTYSAPATGGRPDMFVLTASGRALVWMSETQTGTPHTLYELERESGGWTPVELASNGLWPQGTYGESLVFLGPDHKTLNFVELSQASAGL